MARPDLFDLIPAVSHSDHYVLLAWAALERFTWELARLCRTVACLDDCGLPVMHKSVINQARELAKKLKLKEITDAQEDN